MTKPHHFVVEGPGRDYDYSAFCHECNADAIDCANEWLSERFDALDVGEDVCVTMRVVAGDLDEECNGDSCKLANQPAPHIVVTSSPVGFQCLHCGDSLQMSLPISVDSLCAMERCYRSRHVGCTKPAGGAP